MNKQTTLPQLLLGPTHNPCKAAQTVGRCYGVSRVKQLGTLPLLAAYYSGAGVLYFGEVPALCFSANHKVRTETGTATVIGGAKHAEIKHHRLRPETGTPHPSAAHAKRYWMVRIKRFELLPHLLL